jgi:hypothetical protein
LFYPGGFTWEGWPGGFTREGSPGGLGREAGGVAAPS